MDGGVVPWDSGEFRPGGKVTEGSPAETGERRGRAGRGGRTGLLTRPGAGALSLVDPIEPPPSIITGGQRTEGTTGLLGLSRGPTYIQTVCQAARMDHRASLRLYRLFRMEGTFPRLKERNHVSIMGPGGRTHNCAMGDLFRRSLHKALESGNQWDRRHKEGPDGVFAHHKEAN